MENKASGLFGKALYGQMKKAMTVMVHLSILEKNTFMNLWICQLLLKEMILLQSLKDSLLVIMMDMSGQKHFVLDVEWSMGGLLPQSLGLQRQSKYSPIY